jgi:hypothetical protein
MHKFSKGMVECETISGSRLKVIGIVMVLLLLVYILIIASPWSKGNQQVKYECKSCGASGNNDPQSEPVIEKLEGQEKDNAVSRALDSEDFKLVNSILTKAGYQPVLGNSCALRMKKSLEDTSVEYLVVGIDYAGDRESRPVVARVSGTVRRGLRLQARLQEKPARIIG